MALVRLIYKSIVKRNIKSLQKLQRQSKLYAEAYGGGNWEDFEQTKKEDLYRRMGNFVLREMRAYEVGISKKETSFELEKHIWVADTEKEKVKINRKLERRYDFKGAGFATTRRIEYRNLRSSTDRTNI